MTCALLCGGFLLLVLDKTAQAHMPETWVDPNGQIACPWVAAQDHRQAVRKRIVAKQFILDLSQPLDPHRLILHDILPQRTGDIAGQCGWPNRVGELLSTATMPIILPPGPGIPAHPCASRKIRGGRRRSDR